MAVFLDAATCNLADTDQHFKGTYYLNHQGDESISTRLQDTTSQKTATFILFAVRTWYLTSQKLGLKDGASRCLCMAKKSYGLWPAAKRK
jgi:hypothetical protein